MTTLLEEIEEVNKLQDVFTLRMATLAGTLSELSSLAYGRSCFKRTNVRFIIPICEVEIPRLEIHYYNQDNELDTSYIHLSIITAPDPIEAAKAHRANTLAKHETNIESRKTALRASLEETIHRAQKQLAKLSQD